MTVGEVKAWLESYTDTLRKIFRAEEALKEARERATSIGAKLGDGMPRAHGVKTDLSDHVVRVYELAQRAATLDARAEAIADGICDELGWADLTQIEMRVIVERYLRPERVVVTSGKIDRRDGYKLREWSRIAQRLKVSEDRVYKAHGKALGKIADSRTRWERGLA